MAADFSVVEQAPAKINLYLHVTGRRDDGYHLLDSLVVFASSGDVIEATPAEEFSLSYDGPYAGDLPSPSDNLVLKASQSLATAFDISSGLRIKLTKNLPVASGIGGGSADAAAVLRAGCNLWDIDREDPRLRDLALSIGADVPVCLGGQSCVMRGIGDELSPIDNLASFNIVLANPGVALSTPDVFKKRHGDFSAPYSFSPASPARQDVLAALLETRNDLEPSAISLAPEVNGLLTALANQPACDLSRMSGSGATCFGIFDTAENAENAADHLSQSGTANWAVACRTQSPPIKKTL